MADRRNPYLILGVDFASSPEEASVAFAKTSRRLRQDSSIFAMEDATWALHQIEQASSDPLVDLDVYRVPADPGLFEDPRPIGGFAGAPQNIERQSAMSDSSVAQLRATVLREELTQPLMDWYLAPYIAGPEPDSESTLPDPEPETTTPSSFSWGVALVLLVVATAVPALFFFGSSGDSDTVSAPTTSPPPVTTTNVATTTTTTTVIVSLSWQLGACASEQSDVATLTSCSSSTAALYVLVVADLPSDPLSSSEVEDLQIGLTILALDPGPADGQFGPRTEAATADARPLLGLAEDASIRQVLAGLRARFDPALETDADSRSLVTDSNLCGILPYIEFASGLMCFGRFAEAP